MRRLGLVLVLLATVVTHSSGVWAEPTFVNGLVIPGDTLDATREPGANAGRFGFFSDIYYDPMRDEWWALSDRGPGGGVLDYATRLQRFDLDVHPVTGRISHFRVKETIKLTDPGRAARPRPIRRVGEPRALNGLNPLPPERQRRGARPQLRSRRAGRSIRGPALHRRRRVRAVGLRVQPPRAAPARLPDARQSRPEGRRRR